MPALYDTIGSTYGATRGADPGLTARLAGLLQLAADGQYLDLACGTGNYTSALAARGGTWFGCDLSEVMLRSARCEHPELVLCLANATDLPFVSGRFNGAICTLAVHHFTDLDAAFREVRRVIKSGHFVIFTGLAEQMKNYWLWHYFPDMMRQSTEAMPDRDSIVGALRLAGFDQVLVEPLFVDNKLEDLFLYSGKHRPEIYFSPTVRRNISSFAKFCSEPELERGLLQLSEDVASGAFKEVVAQFDHSTGDYAFVVGSTYG